MSNQSTNSGVIRDQMRLTLESDGFGHRNGRYKAIEAYSYPKMIMKIKNFVKDKFMHLQFDATNIGHNDLFVLIASIFDGEEV